MKVHKFPNGEIVIINDAETTIVAYIHDESLAPVLAAAPLTLGALKDVISSVVEDWPPDDWDDNHLLMIQATAGDIREARAAIAAAEPNADLANGD